MLQIGAVLLIALIALKPAEGHRRSVHALVGIVIAAALLALLQLVPLPPGLWTALPGREPIEEGYRTLGLALPWLPISMTPHATLTAIFFALPFLAVLLGMLFIPRSELRWIVAALVLGTFAGIALGAVQNAGGEQWKIYGVTNTGAVGFFANRNFFGTLLVVNIPFATAVIGSGAWLGSRSALIGKVVGAVYLLAILIGIVLNRSLAAALIAVPVLVASVALLPLRQTWRMSVAAAGAVLLVGLAILLASSPIRSDLLGADAVSVQTRISIWSQSLKIALDTFPFGTGLGSFREVYAFHENPLLVDRWYVNNAHNDYLELLLELGLPGILLAIAFFAWWLSEVRRVWTSAVDLTARAATIASGAILAHSLADYPLRTAAISSILGFCLGAMAISRESPARSPHPTRRKMRHVRIA
jgi:O-antigen ligase